MVGRWLLSALVLLVVALAAQPARAYTPEGGVWWNPREGGTGLFIEIQDNYMVVAAFVGDAAGNPIWYTATGFLTGNARFDATLDYFPGAACIGCPYRAPTAQLGRGGPIRIDFNPNDPTLATLTWGGRTLPIERYQFYLKRPEDGSRPLALTKMLGEWRMVLDFSRVAGSFPYYGDLLVFDRVDLSRSPGFFDGCRAADSIQGFCNASALRDHAASGFHDAARLRHVIVVDDSASNYVVYLLNVGTNDAPLGEFSVYRKGTNPTNFYPVRGWRSASRSFVEEGVGPSKAAVVASSAPIGIGEALPMLFDATALGSVEPSIKGEDLQRILRELEAQISARQTR